jgi:hypothetical protein
VPVGVGGALGFESEEEGVAAAGRGEGGKAL